jgi:hypothetical protein
MLRKRVCILMKKVLLGAPVRDRGWILPRFIEHVKALRLDDILLDTLFIANDCQDNTVELLNDSKFNVKEVNGLPSKTKGSIRGKYGYGHLANLRNILVEEFLKTDCDYLFSVDTDILLPKDSLVKLINHNKDICSMLVCNQNGRSGKRAHNIMEYNYKIGRMVHIHTWKENWLIPIDLTGASYLINREVLEAGVRYKYDFQGEDVPFCKKAKELGFGIYCDTSLKPVHVMASGVELIGGSE